MPAAAFGNRSVSWPATSSQRADTSSGVVWANSVLNAAATGGDAGEGPTGLPPGSELATGLGLGVDLVAGAVGLGEGEGIGTASALAVNAAERRRAAAAVGLD